MKLHSSLAIAESNYTTPTKAKINGTSANSRSCDSMF